MDKTIWYEVRFSEWSPCIEERLVVKETASMIIYETTSRHRSAELVTYQTKARKVSCNHQFFSQKENVRKLGRGILLGVSKPMWDRFFHFP